MQPALKAGAKKKKKKPLPSFLSDSPTSPKSFFAPTDDENTAAPAAAPAAAKCAVAAVSPAQKGLSERNAELAACQGARSSSAAEVGGAATRAASCAAAAAAPSSEPPLPQEKESAVAACHTNSGGSCVCDVPARCWGQG